jgi:hypothetical protein
MSSAGSPTPQTTLLPESIKSIFEDFRDSEFYSDKYEVHMDWIRSNFDINDDESIGYVYDEIFDTIVTTSSLPLKLSLLALINSYVFVKPKTEDDKLTLQSIKTDIIDRAMKIVDYDIGRIGKYLRKMSTFDVVLFKKEILDHIQDIYRQIRKDGNRGILPDERAELIFFNRLAEIIDPIDDDSNPALPVTDEYIEEMAAEIRHPDTLPDREGKLSDEISAKSRTVPMESGKLGGKRRRRRLSKKVKSHKSRKGNTGKKGRKTKRTRKN